MMAPPEGRRVPTTPIELSRRQGRPQKVAGKSVRDRSAIIFQQPAKAHLKPFTVEGNGAAIHLFNLDKQRVITNAPVKNQSARDYFYGQDKRLEAAIQFVEGSYAECINSLPKSFSSVGEAHCMILRRFAYLQ